jgi:hypothetical protein
MVPGWRSTAVVVHSWVRYVFLMGIMFMTLETRQTGRLTAKILEREPANPATQMP